MILAHDGFKNLSEVTTGALIMPVGADADMRETDKLVNPLQEKGGPGVFNTVHRAWDYGRLASDPNTVLIEGDINQNGYDLTLLPAGSRQYGAYSPDKAWVENMLLKARNWLRDKEDSGLHISSLNIPIFDSASGFFKDLPYSNENYCTPITQAEMLQIAQDIFGDADSLVNLLKMDDSWIQSLYSEKDTETDPRFFDRTLDIPPAGGGLDN